MTGIIWLVVIAALAGVVWWLLGPPNPNAPRSSGPGAGAVGTVYELLNEDKRKAIEIIVEQRAGARDAEDADGNLPDLVAPRPRTTPNAESQERPDSEETEQT